MASTRTSFANVTRSSLSRNDTRRSGGRRRTGKHVVGGRTVGKAHGRGRRVSRVSGTADQAEVDTRMDMEAMIAAEVVSGDSDGSPGELFVLPPDRVEYLRREIPARLRQNRLCVTSDEGEGLEGDEEGESCSIENRESCVNAEEEEDEMWSNEQLMSFLVRHAADEHARPPISRFHVGAAGLGESGTIYLGVNVELHGTTLGQSIHGEQFLIANAFAHGETRLEMLVVNELPCGHCRQFIAEMEGGLDMAVVVPSKEVNVAAGSLLPYAFTPDQIQEHPTQYMFSGRVVDGLVLEDDVRLKSDATAMAALAVRDFSLTEGREYLMRTHTRIHTHTCRPACLHQFLFLERIIH